jgi:hypothetical protein
MNIVRRRLLKLADRRVEIAIVSPLHQYPHAGLKRTRPIARDWNQHHYLTVDRTSRPSRIAPHEYESGSVVRHTHNFDKKREGPWERIPPQGMTRVAG